MNHYSPIMLPMWATMIYGEARWHVIYVPAWGVKKEHVIQGTYSVCRDVFISGDMVRWRHWSNWHDLGGMLEGDSICAQCIAFTDEEFLEAIRR